MNAIFPEPRRCAARRRPPRHPLRPLRTREPVNYPAPRSTLPEDGDKGEVEIGWTFLARSHWGRRYNGEMKRLMLQHAFRFVTGVVFIIGTRNVRSQRGIEWIGGVRAATFEALMEWTNTFTRSPHRHSSVARRAMRPRKVETCGEQTVRPIGRRARSQRYRGCRVRIAFSGWRARARAVSEVGLAARELCVCFRGDSTPGRRRHRYARWRATTDFPNAVHVQNPGV